MKRSYMDFIEAVSLGGAHPGGLHLTKSVLSKCQLSKRDKVLDVGCGTGQTAAYIASTYNSNVTACDIRGSMVQKTAQRCKKMNVPVKTLVANAEKLPFPTNSFTHIVSESVTSFTNSSISLREFRRTLVDNGKLIAVEMTRHGRFSKAEEKEITEFYGVKQLFSKKEWIDALRNAGFSRIDILQAASAADHREDTNNEVEMDYVAFDQLSPEYLDVYFKHLDLTGKYGTRLGYCVFICS